MDAEKLYKSATSQLEDSSRTSSIRLSLALAETTSINTLVLLEALIVLTLALDLVEGVEGSSLQVVGRLVHLSLEQALEKSLLQASIVLDLASRSADLLGSGIVVLAVNGGKLNTTHWLAGVDVQEDAGGLDTDGSRFGATGRLRALGGALGLCDPGCSMGSLGGCSVRPASGCGVASGGGCVRSLGGSLRLLCSGLRLLGGSRGLLRGGGLLGGSWGHNNRGGGGGGGWLRLSAAWLQRLELLGDEEGKTEVSTTVGAGITGAGDVAFGVIDLSSVIGEDYATPAFTYYALVICVYL